jgi:CspA family cold shock protein
MKGSIVRKRDEGYGFIKPEEGEKDVFFHASSLTEVAFDDLNEGDVVTFDVEEGPKGPSATNVQKVEGEAAPATEETPAEEATTEEAPATEEVEETPEA